MIIKRNVHFIDDKFKIHTAREPEPRYTEDTPEKEKLLKEALRIMIASAIRIVEVAATNDFKLEPLWMQAMTLANYHHDIADIIVSASNNMSGATPFTDTLDTIWTEFVADSGLTGISLVIANHTRLTGIEGNTLRLELPARQAPLMNDRHVGRIEKALQHYRKEEIYIRFV